jgi:hypothetical protein
VYVRPGPGSAGLVVTALLLTSCTLFRGDTEAPRSFTCGPERVPHESPEAPAVAFPRGSGPVFVGLGTGGIVHYTADRREEEGWHYYKSLWAVAPTYRGPVTITGREVEGTERLRFSAGGAFPGPKLTELRFPAESGSTWRFGPSDTLFRAPGCYAFNVRGDGFRYAITFRAEP